MSLPYSKKIMAFVFLIIISLSASVNYFIKLESYRNLASDAISISSILVAVLGVYFGILSTLEEKSSFFKKAKKYGQNNNIMVGLIKYIGLNVYINLGFIFITIIYDVVPHVNNRIIRILANTIWLSLFLIILLGTITTVNFIMKIYLFKDENNQRLES